MDLYLKQYYCTYMQNNCTYILNIWTYTKAYIYIDLYWPARSPDLIVTPSDFFLWGYLKSKVYVTSPGNMNQLRDRITKEGNQLKDDPGLIRRVVKTMRSRAQLCLRRNGGHVEGNGL